MLGTTTPEDRDALDDDLAELDNGTPHELLLDFLDPSLGVENVECIGEYPDLPAYVRFMLADLVDPAVTWILQYLDYEAVLGEFERDGLRYHGEAGRVYRWTSAAD
jgi:hypothetical protein